MNYRHPFHAGNFADVFKHIILTRIIFYLCRKEAPFRIIDTHAGEGCYDLGSEESQRTGEWRLGIGRLLESLSEDLSTEPLLSSYLACVGVSHNPTTLGSISLGSISLGSYPGSPQIALKMMRQQDRAIFCELRPDAAIKLKRECKLDVRVKALQIDGYSALKAFVPPKERRGLVLIDPPFEDKDEFKNLFSSFEEAYKKWQSGIYAMWYPCQTNDHEQNFYNAFSQKEIKKSLRLTFSIGGLSHGLRHSGMIIVNPPYTLEDEARAFLPILAKKLSQGRDAGWSVDWLMRE
jgi:23S rRNA (adenine2030-N6)-methyltransferase